MVTTEQRVCESESRRAFEAYRRDVTFYRTSGAGNVVGVIRQGEVTFVVEVRGFANRHFVRPRYPRQGIGTNKRTGEFAGAGAAIGAIIGAVAGGGKGAAIGTGAGGGLAAEVLTKGGAIKIPAETVLTFRLDMPLKVVAAR